MWDCKTCHETIEDNLDACWNCGTAKDGTPDPNFRRADDPAVHEARPADTFRSVSMFSCPHCGKMIETGPREKVPWWRYDPGGPTVGLGCGTLILIAIIVSIFSRGRNGSDEIRALRSDVQSLEKKVDSLETSVRRVAVPEAAREQ